MHEEDMSDLASKTAAFRGRPQEERETPGLPQRLRGNTPEGGGGRKIGGGARSN